MTVVCIFMLVQIRFMVIDYIILQFDDFDSFDSIRIKFQMILESPAFH